MQESCFQRASDHQVDAQIEHSGYSMGFKDKFNLKAYFLEEIGSARKLNVKIDSITLSIVQNEIEYRKTIGEW